MDDHRVGFGSEDDAQMEVRPAVVVLCTEMMQSIRIRDVVELSGGRAVVVDVAGALHAVDQSFPVLILADLAAPGNWAEVIRSCKLRPHTRQVPIYAFGSHVDATALRQAREAGADHAWARGRMMKQLADVVLRHVEPPVRYLEGWDDELSDRAKEGIDAFNAGEYFEQHELLEEAWMVEERPIREMYQGILQVGLAFYQIEQGRWTGAMKMFGRGMPKLRGLPEISQGVKVGDFRRRAEVVRDEIVRLGAAAMADYDRRRFPEIEVVN